VQASLLVTGRYDRGLYAAVDLKHSHVAPEAVSVAHAMRTRIRSLSTLRPPVISSFFPYNECTHHVLIVTNDVPSADQAHAQTKAAILYIYARGHHVIAGGERERFFAS